MSFRHRFKINHRRLKRMGFGENRRIRKAFARKDYARAFSLGVLRNRRVLKSRKK